MSPSNSATNLAIIVDCYLNFCCFYHICDMCRIHRHLSLDNAKTIAAALIGSRPDYCNSLFYNIADMEITKLQHVQNVWLEWSVIPSFQ